MAVKHDFADTFGQLMEALKKLNGNVEAARSDLNSLSAKVSAISDDLQSVDKRVGAVEDEVSGSVVDEDALSSIQDAAASLIDAINSTSSEPPASQPEVKPEVKPEVRAEVKDETPPPAGEVANAGAAPVATNPLVPPVPAGTLPGNTRVAEATPGVVPASIVAGKPVALASALPESVMVVPVK